jgi:hypothetical protein
MCELDPRYYGERTLIAPEERHFQRDQAVDYLRGPRPITGAVSRLGIGWVWAVQESVCAGTVVLVPKSMALDASGKG